MQDVESCWEFSWGGALGGAGEAGREVGGPAGGVGLVGTAGVEKVEVGVIMGDMVVLL